ncbi:MAG: Gfo/Idh/MocA family protein [Gemmatimonadales bacterium]
MRLGLLGCGSVACWIHLPALRRIPGAVLAAAADPDPAARARAGRVAGVPTYERADQLLEREDIGAVLICAPTHLHAELAIAAAEAGKHFYLEKPLATTALDAGRVLDATARAGVIGVIGFNRRLHPLYQQARELLRGGCIGRIRAAQSAFCEPTTLDVLPQWKRHRATGGGVLLDLASHHVDQLRWLLGDEVGSISASLRSELSEDDTARIELSMESGIEVQGFFSFRSGLADYLECIGELGTLRIDRYSGSLTLRVGRRLGYGVRRRWVGASPAGAAWRLARLLRPSFDPSYRRSLRAFVELVHGAPSRTASLLDGLRSLEAVLAAEDSARRGEAIRPDRRSAGATCAHC